MGRRPRSEAWSGSFFYLVRAVLGTGVLSYDSPGLSQVEPRDGEITASGAACP